VRACSNVQNQSLVSSAGHCCQCRPWHSHLLRWLPAMVPPSSGSKFLPETAQECNVALRGGGRQWVCDCVHVSGEVSSTAHRDIPRAWHGAIGGGTKPGDSGHFAVGGVQPAAQGTAQNGINTTYSRSCLKQTCTTSTCRVVASHHSIGHIFACTASRRCVGCV
jgi:hypothetical protein